MRGWQWWLGGEVSEWGWMGLEVVWDVDVDVAIAMAMAMLARGGKGL